MMVFSIWAKTTIIMAITLLIQHLPCMSSSSVGVNLGLNGDNLPSPEDTVNLYVKCQISMIRLFEPKLEILNAMRLKPILVSLGVSNQDIQSLASDQSAADRWVRDHVAEYYDVDIDYITLGNEVIPGPEAQFVAQAITNINTALANNHIQKNIKVTTVISSAALAASFPPSAGAFSDDAAGALRDVAAVLVQHGWPVLINVYPYFAVVSDPEHVSLEYALFTAPGTVVSDGAYEYQNLFDAIVDAFVAAFDKIGYPRMGLQVGETGWPSFGNEPYTSVENARTYNRNLKNHILSGLGTPRRPNQTIITFLFEMFNENQKPAGVEQNFGLFYPNMQPVYPLWSC